MVDFEDCSQSQLWLYASLEQLHELRRDANEYAVRYLVNLDTSDNKDDKGTLKAPSARSTAVGYRTRTDPVLTAVASTEISEDIRGKHITPREELTLLRFYANKLPSLIGPKATISRLRRDSKVTATALTLYRRFFLSNSVLLYDPKAILVAAAFLATKVEDATADVRFLESATAELQAPVAQKDILAAELQLITGVHFDLLCYHPFKPLLAVTEDMRTFFKSERGKRLLAGSADISGHDLKPVYDQARSLLDMVVIHSDLQLLYTPAQLALGAFVVAAPEHLPVKGYLEHRFGPQTTILWAKLQELVKMMRELQANPPSDDLAELKGVHKKLKQVRLWDRKVKKRKKNNEDADDAQEMERSKKRVKSDE